jgi:uncharacterized membrane protein YhaH (DUF805 family)
LLFALVTQNPVSGGWVGDARFWSVWSVGQLPGSISIASLMARRLHDLGKSAIWLIPIFAYYAMICLVAFLWPEINDTGMALPLVLPMFVVAFWLIGAPGEKRDNRFGPMTKKD